MQFISVTDGNLVFDSMAKPAIERNECLIKVSAIGINRADLLQRAGKYPAPKGESPILGLEISGVIDNVGQDVSDFAIGDRVYGLVGGGGYAEYAAINANHLMKLPSDFSMAQGAATAEVFLTAYQSLFTIAKLQANETVLIHAGASGVGSAAIQLAKSIGCKVVTTTSSAAKVEACLSFGADVALNYNEVSITQWSKEHQPQGFDVILDVVAGDYVNQNINVSALDARIVILSMLGGRYAEQVDIAKMLMKRVQLSASTLRNRSATYKTTLIKAFEQQFYSQLEQGAILPVIDSVYSWRESELAHQKMADNLNIGKLILTVD